MEPRLAGIWQQLESMIAAVGGYEDAMTPPQISKMVEAAELYGVGSLAMLEQADHADGTPVGGKARHANIPSYSMLSRQGKLQQSVLTRSFTFFSQRFVFDS
jgi:hypothetical protein